MTWRSSPARWLTEGDPELRHLIITTATGGTATRYQVLAGVRAVVPPELSYAVIGPDGSGRTAYDALHDPVLTRVLLRGIAGQRTEGPLRFAREPTAPAEETADTADSYVLSAEQSNTSLIFGESAILKVFRRVFAGQNPDLEVAQALARLGSQHIAQPFGWIEARLDDGEPALLAILSEYLRGACDGWSLALTSLRDLYAGTGRAAEAGGDFAGEATRLGAATASVHADLATAFGTGLLEPAAIAELAAQMLGRFQAASAEVPELAAQAGKITAAYARLAEPRRAAAHPAGARRLPSRAGAADPDRVGGTRLRRRACHPAGAPPLPGARAAGRCWHAEVIRLCRAAPADRPSRRGPPDRSGQ